MKVSCEECKKELERCPSQIANRKYGAFCDRHCLGKFRTKVLVGDRAANYKYGWRQERKYIQVHAPWHPNHHHGYQYLHRLMIEAKLGRFLRSDEIVHHRDNDPSNNHWNNLELTSQSDHAKHHFTEYQRNKRGQIRAKSKNL